MMETSMMVMVVIPIVTLSMGGPALEALLSVLILAKKFVVMDLILEQSNAMTETPGMGMDAPVLVQLKRGGIVKEETKQHQIIVMKYVVMDLISTHMQMNVMMETL